MLFAFVAIFLTILSLCIANSQFRCALYDECSNERVCRIGENLGVPEYANERERVQSREREYRSS